MHCKCKNIPTTLNKVTLDFPMKKITEYLFAESGKLGLMKSMGYSVEDSEEIYNKISSNAKKKFLNGEYNLGLLNQHGQIVNIEISLNGKSLKSNSVYNFITGWTAYPDRKLHNNTPFGGWVK